MAEKIEPKKLTDSRLKIFNDSALPSPKKPTIFDRPMRLIVNVDGKTTCDLETLAELSKIEKTLNVVSVVGSLRTGKSFLLNKLANTRAGAGFETGHTVKAVTKGIWIMCRPHPTQKDQVLALLDTEGIDDPDKAQYNYIIYSKTPITRGPMGTHKMLELSEVSSYPKSAIFTIITELPESAADVVMYTVL